MGVRLLSKIELEISGAEFVIVKDLEAPEAAHHLWYLFHHLVYPRALFNKPVLITSPLGYEEFITYGAGVRRFGVRRAQGDMGKAAMGSQCDHHGSAAFSQAESRGNAAMLKAEYPLYKALKERGLDVVPQHVIGDYMLDFALTEKQNKVDIEVDVFASIDHNKPTSQEVKRNLQLLNDGWKILRFSTAEVLSSVAIVLMQLKKFGSRDAKNPRAGGWFLERSRLPCPICQWTMIPSDLPSPTVLVRRLSKVALEQAKAAALCTASLIY